MTYSLGNRDDGRPSVFNMSAHLFNVDFPGTKHLINTWFLWFKVAIWYRVLTLIQAHLLKRLSCFIKSQKMAQHFRSLMNRQCNLSWKKSSIITLKTPTYLCSHLRQSTAVLLLSRASQSKLFMPSHLIISCFSFSRLSPGPINTTSYTHSAKSTWNSCMVVTRLRAATTRLYKHQLAKPLLKKNTNRY